MRHRMHQWYCLHNHQDEDRQLPQEALRVLISFSTDPPSLFEFTSKSSNNPFKSSSLSKPFAEFSILLKTDDKVSFKFASFLHFLRTFTKARLVKYKILFLLQYQHDRIQLLCQIELCSQNFFCQIVFRRY